MIGYPGTYPKTLADLFDRSTPEPNTGCWLWMGFVRSDGYAQVSTGAGVDYIHRIAVRCSGRDIPQGMVVDHICRVRSCCNPDHLRVVTQRQNTTENSVSIQAQYAARTCCQHCGGPFTTLNWKKGPLRQCLPCKRKRHAIHKKANWAREMDNQRKRRAAQKVAGG